MEVSGNQFGFMNLQFTTDWSWKCKSRNLEIWREYVKLWEWMSSPRERQEKMRKVPKNSNMKRSQQRRQKQKQRGKRGDCNVPEAKEGESFREEREC